jgi:hypothetical protein
MPRATAEGAPLRCPSCRAENFGFASFCIVCGEPLSEADTVPALSESFQESLYAVSQSERPISSSASTAASRKAIHRETILGLAILLLALAYVLYDWQHRTAQADAYQSGVAAELSRNWDAAVVSFEQAGDHPDAARRKEHAAQQVAERDRLYDEGKRAADQSNWGLAITDLSRVQAIQPSYRDAPTLLAGAKDQAYKSGLDDIIYLVGRGASPGLYMRDAQGSARLLPGSDGRSTIRAISDDGSSFVYDRPATEADYAGVPPSDLVPQNALEAGAVRRIPVLAARGSGGGPLTTIPLPQLDATGTGVFSQDGLWWYSSQPSSGSFGYEVFYTTGFLQAPPILMRISDIQNGKRVVALDPPRLRVIIAEATGDPRGDALEARLYVADASGDHARFIQTAQGAVYQAQVSRDGKWLLYVTQVNGSEITRTAWALSLNANQTGPGFGPARKVEELSWGGLEMNAHLNATFVPSDDSPPEVMVSRTDSQVERLTVYGLQTPGEIYSLRRQADPVYRRDLSAFGHVGQFVASRWQLDNQAFLELVAMPPGSRSWESVHLPAFLSQIVDVQFAPHDNYLLAAVRNPEGIDHGIEQLIYSARVGADGTLGEPALIASAAMPYDDMPAIALPAGGSLVVYVDPAQEMHALFYNGSGDTLLASGVRAVWSLNARDDLTWRR